MKLSHIALWGVCAVVGSVAGCQQQKAVANSNMVTGHGHGNNSGFTVEPVNMYDGTTCYVATESGHGIAMHCFRKDENK